MGQQAQVQGQFPLLGHRLSSSFSVFFHYSTAAAVRPPGEPPPDTENAEASEDAPAAGAFCSGSTVADNADIYIRGDLIKFLEILQPVIGGLDQPEIIAVRIGRK